MTATVTVNYADAMKGRWQVVLIGCVTMASAVCPRRVLAFGVTLGMIAVLLWVQVGIVGGTAFVLKSVLCGLFRRQLPLRFSRYLVLNAAELVVFFVFVGFGVSLLLLLFDRHVIHLSRSPFVVLLVAYLVCNFFLQQKILGGVSAGRRAWHAVLGALGFPLCAIVPFMGTILITGGSVSDFVRRFF